MEFLVRFLHQTTTRDWIVWEPWWLYIVRFLHQTTTGEVDVRNTDRLYIVRFLHQTTTACQITSLTVSCISSVSYIKPQLTYCKMPITHCCISSVSYIKPQLNNTTRKNWRVVYRPFPTSNHNNRDLPERSASVVYRPFPTSNHNLIIF